MESRKKIRDFLLAIAVILMMAGLMAVFTKVQFDRYRSIENQCIASMINEVQKEYPKADLTGLIQILNGVQRNEEESGPVYGKLAQYGITEDTYFILDLRKREKRILAQNSWITAGLGGMLLLLFYFYERRNRKRLVQLEQYMEKVAEGNYDLSLKSNSNEAFSRLKNQIYKIALMLKEQAVNAGEKKKALSESVSDISHQLKTPLTSVSILLDNLLDAPDMDVKTQRRFLKEMEHQVLSMNWMVISMLKLSRLDAGVVEFESTRIELQELLSEVCGNLEVIAELQQVELNLQRTTAAICGDYNWNREAVMNIVKNAIEHSPKGEKVTIKVEQNGVYTAIHVSNFGATITREQQKKMFTRYYTESRTITENTSSSSGSAQTNNVGLGLPLAKAILEKQDGYLTVESENGTNTFTMKYIQAPQGTCNISFK